MIAISPKERLFENLAPVVSLTCKNLCTVGAKSAQNVPDVRGEMHVSNSGEEVCVH